MFIIGIAGGTGSGKTTVVKKIVEEIPGAKVSVIPQDSYYKAAEPGVPLEVLQQKNFDHPDAFDWDLLFQQVNDLRNGKSIEQPTYSFLKCDRLPETIRVEPTNVIIVEGIMALYRKELRDLMDLKIFVDADPDERLIRVIERDVIERGKTAREVMSKYRRVLKPMHRQFIEPTKEYADLIIPQGGNNIKAINIMRAYIRKKMHEEE
ncbi:uridine kinase [Pseudoprevotella muciniphila]|uniref:Uridine kinase n=1 Tax=Pseudoprevotella muciniphila TaxID=2133944 RepID=A0A5P8E3Z5_9BACT|nr:uridine kinase [Pseudoprevotella muciniphila]QFQ11672.1 uridine kinase [Pseudoprevotella muciniphila]